MAVGQESRPEVVVGAFRALGDRARLPSRLRDGHDPPVVAREEDRAAGAPAHAALGAADGNQRLDQPALDLQDPQLSFPLEPEPATVGRPEGRASAGGLRQHSSLVAAHGPEPDRLSTLRVDAHEGELRAVGRERESVDVARDLDAAGRDDRGDDAGRGWLVPTALDGPQVGCYREHGERDRGCRDRPGQPTGAPRPLAFRRRLPVLQEDLGEVEPEIRGRVVPVAWVARQTTPHDPAEAERRLLGQHREFDRLAQDGRQGVGRRRLGEEAASGQHLPEHHPEGPEISAQVGHLPPSLLGAHVGRRPQDDALLGHRRREGR